MEASYNGFFTKIRNPRREAKQVLKEIKESTKTNIEKLKDNITGAFRETKKTLIFTSNFY